MSLFVAQTILRYLLLRQDSKTEVLVQISLPQKPKYWMLPLQIFRWTVVMHLQLEHQKVRPFEVAIGVVVLQEWKIWRAVSNHQIMRCCFDG